MRSCLLVLVMCGVRLGGFDHKKWPFDALETLNQQPVNAPGFSTNKTGAA